MCFNSPSRGVGERKGGGWGQSMVEVNRWVSQIHRLEATDRERQPSQRISGRQRQGGKKTKRRVEKRHAELGTADGASQNLGAWKSNLEIHKDQPPVLTGGREMTRTGGGWEVGGFL